MRWPQLKPTLHTDPKDLDGTDTGYVLLSWESTGANPHWECPSADIFLVTAKVISSEQTLRTAKCKVKHS